MVGWVSTGGERGGGGGGDGIGDGRVSVGGGDDDAGGGGEEEDIEPEEDVGKDFARISFDRRAFITTPWSNGTCGSWFTLTIGGCTGRFFFGAAHRRICVLEENPGMIVVDGCLRLWCLDEGEEAFFLPALFVPEIFPCSAEFEIMTGDESTKSECDEHDDDVDFKSASVDPIVGDGDMKWLRLTEEGECDGDNE